VKLKLYYVSIFLSVSLLISYLYLYKIEPFQNLSLRFNDYFFAYTDKEPSSDIVFVAIDEASINKFGRWPWQRSILAQGVEKLKEADVVLIDIVFSETTTAVEDQHLAEAISSLQNSVCGFFLRNNATQSHEEALLDILLDSSLDSLQMDLQETSSPDFLHASFAEINIEPVLQACSYNGVFSTIASGDFLYRSYPIAFYYKNSLYPSLAIQALRVRYNEDIEKIDEKNLLLSKQQIKVDEQGFVRLNFYNPSKYKIISFLDVVQGNIKEDYFKDKIVLLGINERGVGDVVSTPVGTISGALLHYTFLSNFLQNELVQEVQGPVLLFIVLFAFIPMVLIITVKRVGYRSAIGVLSSSLFYLFARYLYDEQKIYIDTFYPLMSFVLSTIIMEVVNFNYHESKEKFLKNIFASYLSNELLDKLLKNPDAIKLGGEEKELSILFSDIRSFTSLSEKVPAEKLVMILNRYFTPMTEAVLSNRGMLDKYIGDAVMAFFNAPVDVCDHADAACQTALDMIEKLELLNKELESENLPTIKIGIGIHTGDVIVGNIGSRAKQNYTVIGDSVNIASRIESLTKRYRVNILISQSTAEQLDKSKYIYREIESVQLKGKNHSVLLYELLANNEKNRRLVAKYTEAYDAYKEANYFKAELLFRELIDEENDFVSIYQLEYIVNKEAWKIRKMKEK